ncbi:UNVERIFIED_CONTAM: hypothetical protein Sradi_1577100 [Sesamum radiatum]|uniref:Uncharacterized protein n=1 Tax=Sesamum radiatum TaxID=300843 RepID=A0AAW2U958_SESRA
MLPPPLSLGSFPPLMANPYEYPSLSRSTPWWLGSCGLCFYDAVPVWPDRSLATVILGCGPTSLCGLSGSANPEQPP